MIKEELFKLAEFKRAKLVMFYIATDKEVETSFMIAEAQKIGKKIVVPTILVEEKRMIASLIEDLKADLSQGPYGIAQPKRECIHQVAGKLIDLVVVPGHQQALALQVFSHMLTGDVGRHVPLPEPWN